MPNRATLKTVAAAAGVSTATVARVLHAKGYVAPATRDRVEAALAETGYRLNAVAQGLRKRRTLTIGHLLHSIAPNPFFAAVALGVDLEAAKHGCSALLYQTHGDAEREHMGVETLIRRRVDAILFTTAVQEANVCLAARAGIPVVQVERQGALETLAVTVDNYVGAAEAVRHLIDLGHRRIAFIGDDPANVLRHTQVSHCVEHERLQGYLATVGDRLGTADQDLIILARDYERQTGYDAAQQLLTLSNPPTAIFATCDLLAAGVLQCLYERGYAVPRDMSVVGFDDTIASLMSPPLTTVAQPMVNMGQRAAALAFAAIETPADGLLHSRVIRLSTRLTVRASTGPPAGR